MGIVGFVILKDKTLLDRFVMFRNLCSGKGFHVRTLNLFRCEWFMLELDPS